MKYSCNCNRISFTDRKYSYWEKRNTTNDEIDIINVLLDDKTLINKNILHIGIGNSEFAKRMDKSNNISGITISNSEIDYGNSLNLKNYKIFFCDKYSLHLEKIFKNSKFDLIIDTNLKSYACCQNAFDYMMKSLFNILTSKGKIITSINGMGWFKSLKPKLSFNLKRFFYYKMKEVTGDPNNILKETELRNICSIYGIKILFDKKLCYLLK